MSADALLTLDKVAKRLAVSIRTVRRADVYPPQAGKRQAATKVPR